MVIACWLIVLLCFHLQMQHEKNIINMCHLVWLTGLFHVQNVQLGLFWFCTTSTKETIHLASEYVLGVAVDVDRRCSCGAMVVFFMCNVQPWGFFGSALLVNKN